MMPRPRLMIASAILGRALGLGATIMPAQAQQAGAPVTLAPYTSYDDLYKKDEQTRAIIATFGSRSQRPLIDARGAFSQLSDTVYLFRFADDCAPLGCRTIVVDTRTTPATLGMYVYAPGPFTYDAATSSLFVCTNKGESVEWKADAQGEFTPAPFPLDQQRDTCQPLMPE